MLLFQKSFAGLTDRLSPDLREKQTRSHIGLPLPEHFSPEVTRGKKVRRDVQSEIAVVLGAEKSEREAA